MSLDSIKRANEPEIGIEWLARKAVAKVAEQFAMDRDTTTGLNTQFVEQLYEAVASTDRLRPQKIIDDMLAQGLRTTEIADFYIPAVAAKLGEAWCEDNIDFAVTTIGSARLQGLLRSLGPEWCADDRFLPETAPRLLVCVPQHCQHTLGAMLISGQLRRKGIAVDLELGRPNQEILTLMRQSRYDGLLISASAREKLETIRKIVKTAKSASADIPVIVGGGVIAQDLDIADLTGADLATSSVEHAVSFCNMTRRQKVKGA